MSITDPNSPAMPTLELKHLAPYWPYGLRIIDKSKDTASKFFIQELSLYDLTQGQIDIINKYGCRKPILRPMSDLEDGKQWIDKLQEECNHTVSYNEGSFSDSYSDEFTIDWLPQICFNWLIKNHFDVFSLITAGLAIDINELNKTES